MSIPLQTREEALTSIEILVESIPPQYGSAAKICLQLLERDPRDVEVYNRLGECCYSDPQIETLCGIRAVEVFQASLRVRATSEAYFHLALLLEGEALGYYRRAADLLAQEYSEATRNGAVRNAIRRRIVDVQAGMAEIYLTEGVNLDPSAPELCLEAIEKGLEFLPKSLDLLGLKLAYYQKTQQDNSFVELAQTIYDELSAQIKAYQSDEPTPPSPNKKTTTKPATQQNQPQQNQPQQSLDQDMQAANNEDDRNINSNSTQGTAASSGEGMEMGGFDEGACEMDDMDDSGDEGGGVAEPPEVEPCLRLMNLFIVQRDLDERFIEWTCEVGEFLETSFPPDHRVAMCNAEALLLAGRYEEALDYASFAIEDLAQEIEQNVPGFEPSPVLKQRLEDFRTQAQLWEEKIKELRESGELREPADPGEPDEHAERRQQGEERDPLSGPVSGSKQDQEAMRLDNSRETKNMTDETDVE